MSLPHGDHQVVLLHNPRCSKSRATHALLTEREIPFTERLYLEDPLTRDELVEVGRRLGRSMGEWIRAKEDDYAAAGLSPASSEDHLLSAVAANPILMERPVVLRGERAAIGRPPEDALALFD